jgi:hypothetical protein
MGDGATRLAAIAGRETRRTTRPGQGDPCPLSRHSPRADGRRARADPAGALAGGCEMSVLASESLSQRLREAPTERSEGLR